MTATMPLIETDRLSPIVVCAADNRYAMQLSVVLRSILDHLASDRSLRLFVIDGGITQRSKAKILRSIDASRCAITWLPATVEALGEVSVTGHVSIATYFRLLIPTLLPSTIDKVIYLDSDLIVTQDLSQLWDIDLGDRPVFAAQQIEIPYVSSPQGLANYQELGLPADAKYFNAGVLLMNLRQWRQEKISEQAIAYLNRYKDIVRYWDQDGLNAVLAGRWGELDPRWNQTPGIFSLPSWQHSALSESTFQKVLHHPYIIHFATAAKPWNSREVYPANGLFFHYVDLTAWSGWRLTIWRRLWNRIQRDVAKWLP